MVVNFTDFQSVLKTYGLAVHRSGLVNLNDVKKKNEFDRRTYIKSMFFRIKPDAGAI